jgi:HAD superfamily hydrolase (TIGR01549 family)
VLVFPNWARVSEALAGHGVPIPAPTLAAAEPAAKRQIDLGETVSATSDRQRGWLYFNLVLTHAGVELSDATDAALADLQTYHDRVNLWEQIPDDVVPALSALRLMGLQLVVVSNANGRLRRLFERLGLAPLVDVLLDSHDEGVEKPDPRLFEIALARSGGRKDTTVHVGDLYHVDVMGARATGLRAVLIDPLDLYLGYDCVRVRTLSELVAWVDQHRR